MALLHNILDTMHIFKPEKDTTFQEYNGIIASALKIQLPDNKELIFEASDILDDSYIIDGIFTREHIYKKLIKFNKYLKPAMVIWDKGNFKVLSLRQNYKLDSDNYAIFSIESLDITIKINFDKLIIQFIFMSNSDKNIDKISIKLYNSDKYITLSEYLALIKMTNNPNEFEDNKNIKHIVYSIIQKEIKGGILIDYTVDSSGTQILDNIQLYKITKRHTK